MKSRVIPSSETKKPGSFDTGGGVERGRSCVRKCSNDEYYPGWVRGGMGEVIRPDGGMLFRQAENGTYTQSDREQTLQMRRLKPQKEQHEV
ncbi:hypothetical protein TNCV_849261 [Trichonephila clavipes]|uniref:Uncharacterized protein n=1 Tax=Trichonephila clavipes TaxID=2585209 RepID=A0A8X6RHE7_TRICX|nr:hypothetical protein TNCV_849261 [Trichonephila clavipes]